MALTGRRWLALAILGCLALAVASLPGGAEEVRPANPHFAGFLARRHSGAEFRSRLVGEASHGLVLLRLRDHILDSLARNHAASPPISFRLGGRLSQPPADLLAAATDSVAQFLAPSSPFVSTLLITHPDTAYLLRDGRRAALYGLYYLLPPATNGKVCLVLAREYDIAPLINWLRDTSARASQDRRAGLTRALGPCAFYTAFGLAGPGIERWLRDEGYAPAGRAQWDRPRPPYGRPDQDELTDVGPSSFWEILRAASSGAFDMGRLSLPARACAHGELSLCPEALTTSFADLHPPLGRHNAVAHSWWFAEEPAFGFLSDLVRLEGRDRFVRFWRSTLPVDRAFTDAYGVSMEEWTHQWLLGSIAAPRFGPVIRLSSVLVGLGLAVTLALASTLFALRRQVA